MTVPSTDPTRSYHGSPSSLSPGTIIGGYRIESLCGTGGMGAVYNAKDTVLGRAVALKVVRPDLERPDAYQRLLREARAAAAVVHDNVVRIYQVGEDRGIPFIAMEMLAGQSLATRISAGPISPSEVVRIAIEAVNGLIAIHAAGLVHRDLKPANMWLEAGNDRLKLLDFGLARSDDDTCLTRTGAVLGTPAYMAPEQAEGLPVDHRADLFSLGCVLYHMATGERPFTGPNALVVMNRLTNYTPPLVDVINPHVPHVLAELIHDMMAKSPIDRPSSAAAVASRLHQLDAAAKPISSPKSTETTQTVASNAPLSDRQRLLTLLLELNGLQNKIELFTRENRVWWVAAFVSLPGYPILARLLAECVLDEQSKGYVLTFVVVGCLLSLFTWAVPPVLNGKRIWKRKHDRLIEQLNQSFPEQMANWGGPIALQNKATLAAIISRLQGL